MNRSSDVAGVDVGPNERSGENKLLVRVVV
jgi:hypothetical protein